MVNSFIFVSALYANPKSSGEYIRFKGQVEEELKTLNFPKLGIMRPSFLIGNRKEKRVSETIGIFVFKLLSPLLLGPLKKMKPIHSEIVASAMIAATNENLEKNTFESNEIVELVLISFGDLGLKCFVTIIEITEKTIAIIKGIAGAEP